MTDVLVGAVFAGMAIFCGATIWLASGVVMTALSDLVRTIRFMRGKQ